MGAPGRSGAGARSRVGAKWGYGPYALDSRAVRRPPSGDAIGFGVLISATPASAQQIVVQGANVDPSTLKPYFSGTDPASIERGVEDLKATGIFSNVSAKLEDGKIIVTLDQGAQIINRVAFEGNSKIKTNSSQSKCNRSRTRPITRRPPRPTSSASRTPIRNLAAMKRR